MRSNHMSKPRSKRSMYARLRSIDDRRVCCSQRECDRVGASISDAVGGSFALGYAFAVLSFSAPVYGCARPAAKGINKLPQMMAAAAGTGELCLPRVYESSEGNGSLSFELSLFNAVVLQCTRQGLGVNASDRDGCSKVAMGVRDALWLMAGREGEFKSGRVPLRFKEYAKPVDEGGFDVRLGKKPQGEQLIQQRVRGTASKLRSAIDDHKFMRSSLWKEFREDCDELHAVLLDKVCLATGYWLPATRY